MQNHKKKKINTINNNMNENSLDANKINQFKSLDIKSRKLNIKHNNNQFLSEKFKNSLRNKNAEKPNNINEIKGNPEQLDFFQKFIINKNKPDYIEKSPVKNIGINCNLVLTKNKEKNEETNKIGEGRELSGNRNRVSIKDRIILTQKRKNYNSDQRNNKKNKFLNSVFGYNKNKNDIINVKSTEVNTDKINLGLRSCSIKKNHHRKNLKIDLNKKFNNLKITNLNSQSNTIKKEARNNNFILNNHQEININNNLLSLNIVLKTEPKNNHFLDKVIQKINCNKDRKSVKNKNILKTNDYKNDENKQMLRFLSIEKNNNPHEYMGNPFLIKFYKNNENDEDKMNKKSTIHLKEDTYLLHTINQKIENTLNRKSKDKVKKIFPNLMIYGKNKS